MKKLAQPPVLFCFQLATNTTTSRFLTPWDSSQWHVLEVEQGPQDGRCFFSLFSCFFMICPWLSIGNIWVFPKMVEIWMFPKIVGFTPKSSILMGIFHYFHHPFWGTPNFWKHPYIAAGSDELCKVGVANSSRKQLGRCVKLFKKRFCVKFSGLLLWRLYMVTSLYHFSMTFTSFFLNSPLHIAAKKIET